MIAAVLATLLAAGPAPDDAIVGGWVVHAHTGARLPGAMVSMICGPRLRSTAWTDLDGAFVFRGLPAGSCVLIAALGTHTPRVKLSLKVGERRLIDVPLDPEAKTGDYWTLKAWKTRGQPYLTRTTLAVPPGSAVILGGLVVHARTGEGVPGALLILFAALAPCASNTWSLTAPLRFARSRPASARCRSSPARSTSRARWCSGQASEGSSTLWSTRSGGRRSTPRHASKCSAKATP